MKTFIAVLVVILVLIAIGGIYYVDVRPAMAPATSTSTPATNTASSTTTTTTTTTTTGVQPDTASAYYNDTSTWATSRNNTAGFAISYPTDFQVNANNSTTPTSDWYIGSTDPGILALTLTVPQAFEPKTNFVDATLTVGYSQNDQAIANCLVAGNGGGPVTSTTTQTINGINYTIYNTTGVGAGNIYKTASYRTLHAGTCYVIEYTVHSGQLANYPASEGLTQYSDSLIDQVLARVIGTFTFL